MDDHSCLGPTAFATAPIAALAVAVITVAPLAVAADSEPGKAFESGVFVDTLEQVVDAEKLPYRLLRPEALVPGKKYPLVLFLHGAGERGDDNAAQLKHAAAEFLRPDRREKYPAFVVFPQCPKENFSKSKQ